MFPSTSTHQTLYGLGFSDVPFGSQGFAPDATTLGADLNSPEGFKQSIHLVQQQLLRVQGLARSVLAGIEHAYQPGTDPMQTAAEAETLRQALNDLAEFLRQTGVGALPLIDLTNAALTQPSEDKMFADATKAIEDQYAQYKRLQESASTVFNLLTAVDQGVRK